MNWKSHVLEIQETIRSSKKYEDYVPLLENYKHELELALATHPSHVTLASQLASIYMELRHGADESIKILEDILDQHSTTLTSDDQSRLLTNLAYHHSEGYYEPVAIKYLKKAVKLGSNYEQTYAGLGLLLAGEEAYQEAVDCFEKLIILSNDIKYRYNLAVSLYGNGKIQEASGLFEAILEENEQHVKAMYGLATCYATSGEFAKALMLADKMIATGEMENDDLPDIYFLCGEYQLHCEAHQDGAGLRYYFHAGWLAPYFYSLMALGQREELALKYKEIMKEKQLEYDEAVVEEMDEGETEEERRFHLLNLKAEIQEIEEAYERVLAGEKPEIQARLWCEYECYLIDCVRHQEMED